MTQLFNISNITQNDIQKSHLTREILNLNLLLSNVDNRFWEFYHTSDSLTQEQAELFHDKFVRAKIYLESINRNKSVNKFISTNKLSFAKEQIRLIFDWLEELKIPVLESKVIKFTNSK